jgi:hypothetical protein
MQDRKEFIKLLIASFISQSGSHFLTIALAGFVFVRSGSIIKASFIFILSYLPSIIVAARIGDWIDRCLSRWLLVRNELLSIIISSLCGICIAFEVPIVILCTLIALRSLLLFTTRTASIKWIKLITPSALQSLRVKVFYFGFFLSTATAGILAAKALKQPSVLIVVLIDIGTYIFSISIFMALRELSSTEKTTDIAMASFSTLTSLREILKLPTLSPHFTSVCLSQSIFQGAYSVLVYSLPINRFQLGIQGIGPFQIAASLGISIGFVVLWLFPNILAKKKQTRSVALLATLGVGALSLIVCIAIPSIPSSLFSFFLFNAAYECIWLYNVSEFVQRSPQNTLGRYQFVMTSSASCLMAIFTLSYAILIELSGLRFGVTIILLGGLLIWGYVSSLSALQKQAN